MYFSIDFVMQKLLLVIGMRGCVSVRGSIASECVGWRIMNSRKLGDVDALGFGGLECSDSER